MKKESFFLIFVASGVFPVALTYGVNPQVTLAYLYDIEVNNVNLSNIFRAIMGLYIALNIFWVIGAFKKTLLLPAMWSLAIFMTGIGLGRLLSLIIDGMPYPAFILYMLLEFIFAIFGFFFIKKINKT